MTIYDIKTEEEFLSFAKNNQNKLVFLDFYATWCGPCNDISPYIKQLSVKYPNIFFLKIDVDRLPEISAFYKVRAMPTFVILRNNREVTRGTGASTVLINDLIKKAQMKYF